MAESTSPSTAPCSAPEPCAPAAEGAAAEAQIASKDETPPADSPAASTESVAETKKAQIASKDETPPADSPAASTESVAETKKAELGQLEPSPSPPKRQVEDSGKATAAPPKRLKIADLLGSFERNLVTPDRLIPAMAAIPPVPSLPSVPALGTAVLEAALAVKPRKVPELDGKRVLVVRHGEGVHQLKGYAPKEGDLLGPKLTEKGKQQAQAAQKSIVAELKELEMEDLSRCLVVSSNLLRAVHTAVLCTGAKVVVHPSLRERIQDARDEPSELNALREWLMDSTWDDQVDLGLYEAELIEAGAKATDFALDLHEIYLRSCRSNDLKGDAWNAKQNKEMLLERAASFTHWLEEQREDVAIVVGHACFLGMITNDKEWLENGEVRSYNLQQGYWTRQGKLNAVKAVPSAAPNLGNRSRLIPATGRGIGRGSFVRWSVPPDAPSSLRPRGSLAVPKASF